MEENEENESNRSFSPHDMAEQSRRLLVRSGINAATAGMLDQALDYFGAAIRKARSLNLWDFEAEFFKFVALYQDRQYRLAVKRCCEALDAAHFMGELASQEGVFLPRDVVITELENYLGQTMLMRRDSLFSLWLHFSSRGNGEFYAAKQSVGPFRGLFRVWRVLTKSYTVSYNMLANEREVYSRYLDAKLQERGQSGTTGDFGAVSLDSDQPPTVNIEAGWEDFLKTLRPEEVAGLGDIKRNQLLEICRSVSHARLLELVARLLSPLGPHSKEPFLEALAENANLDSLAQEAKSLGASLIEEARDHAGRAR